MNGRKLRVMSDKEVDEFAQRLIAAGKEGEPPVEDVPENELIDTKGDNLVMFVKKKEK
jgi:hypothetical protein